MNQVRFQFNLSTQTLKLVKKDYSLVLGEERKFFYFRSVGFVLEPNQRILFTLKKERILCLYKAGEIVYKREINRPSSGVVEVDFTKKSPVNSNSLIEFSE